MGRSEDCVGKSNTLVEQRKSSFFGRSMYYGLDGELLYLQWTMLVPALWRFQANAWLVQE